MIVFEDTKRKWFRLSLGVSVERSSVSLDFLQLISTSPLIGINWHVLWLDSCFHFVTEHDEFSVVMPPELCAQTVMPSSFVMWDGQQPGEG
jgi:hypothetical protein